MVRTQRRGRTCGTEKNSEMGGKICVMERDRERDGERNSSAMESGAAPAALCVGAYVCVCLS